MMLKFKITYLFLILFSFLSVFCIIQNIAKAQENNNIKRILVMQKMLKKKESNGVPMNLNLN